MSEEDRVDGRELEPLDEDGSDDRLSEGRWRACPRHATTRRNPMNSEPGRIILWLLVLILILVFIALLFSLFDVRID